MLVLTNITAVQYVLVFPHGNHPLCDVFKEKSEFCYINSTHLELLKCSTDSRTQLPKQLFYSCLRPFFVFVFVSFSSLFFGDVDFVS